MAGLEPYQPEQFIYTLQSKGGIKRDGTDLDNPFFQDGQWCRFQRGRPKKMGGYRSITNNLNGPLRATYVDGRSTGTTVHGFSDNGVEQVVIDVHGVGSGIYDRTPAGFTPNSNYTWQVATMYDSGGGNPVIICSASADLNDITADPTSPGQVWYGQITGTSALLTAAMPANTPVAGICVLQPYLFAYGSNGLIINGKANQPAVWAGGESNAANVAGSKIVKGLPIRGGANAPSGMFWGLDCLIRVSFVGGTALWRYDTITGATSIMSSSCVIDYDGVYYWMGTDRFLMYNGVLQELPNQMNINWVFDNLNYDQRQKVWATKVPRYGEIWWHFPSGSSTECDTVAIYNVREQTWYDSKLQRSSGHQVQVFRYPVWSGIEESRSSTYMTYTAGVGSLAPNMILTGVTSAATGTVVKVATGSLNLTGVVGTFQSGEPFTTNSTPTGTLTSAPVTRQLDVLWQQEFGRDKVYQQNISAIRSFFTSNNFGYPTGGPAAVDSPAGVEFQTSLSRVDPDFVQSGTMNLYVEGKSYPASSNVVSSPYPFSTTDEHIDVKEQRRLMALTFESNVISGYYEMGQIVMTLGKGDVRG